MRPYAVFVLLVALLGALGYVLVSRPRLPHPMPGVTLAPPPDGGEGDAGAGGDARVLDAAPPSKLDRALKVTSLGWDVLAAAVVENGGSSPGPLSGFTREGLDVQLVATTAIERLEEKLAKGGTEAEGADVAVVPMPTYVASYERLRALEPEVFLVVGWSRGKEALAARESSLVPAPSGAEVKMLSLAPDAATLLGLFVLDLEGVPLSHVRLIKPGATSPTEDPSEGRSAVSLVAFDRAHADDALANGRHLLLTTADASRLIPIVAIASKGFLDAHREAVTAFAQGFIRGIELSRKDVPAAARQVASIQGAPEAVVLLAELGQTAPASLRENAELMGLSGRTAVTLEKLFASEWQLWRGAGVLSTPAPELAPFTSEAVTALIRADASLTTAVPASEIPPPADVFGKVPASAAPLVSHPARGPKLDENKLAADVGWISGIFEHAIVRVAAPGKAAQRVAALAKDQFGVPASRMAPVASAKVLVDVMSAP